MTFYAQDTADGALRWAIIDAMRRYGADATRVGETFAASHDLRTPDLRALVAIMSAEGTGAPLTPGGLRDILGLSSAGTSYVIDRLERAGHVQRHRDHPTDHRVVHLRYTPQGQAVALAFFGPLGEATERVMDGFTEPELQVVRRFLQAASEAMHDHLERVGRPDGPA